MIYDAMMDYFHSLEIHNADRYLPYYIASIGCHIAHLKNHHFPEFPNTGSFMLNRGANPAGIRLHLLFVTIPGGGKSFYPQLFSNTFSGLLHGTKVPISNHNMMTEAGLCGTASRQGKKVNIDRGIAERYPSNVMIFEEFATAVNQSNEGVKLTNQLLTLLDTGLVSKALGVTEIKFKSWVTLWCATQNARLDLRSGLDRRYLIFSHQPTEEDRRKMLQASLDSYNVTPSIAAVNKIRSMVNRLYDEFNLREVQWSPEYRWWREDMAERRPGFRHQEAAVLDRFAVGYTIMRYHDPGDEVMIVDIDDDFMELAEATQIMRQQQIMDSEAQVVIAMLGDQWVNRRDFIKNRMSPLGYDYRASIAILERMEEMCYIETEKVTSIAKKKGRKTISIRLRDDFEVEESLNMERVARQFA